MICIEIVSIQNDRTIGSHKARPISLPHRKEDADNDSAYQHHKCEKNQHDLLGIYALLFTHMLPLFLVIIVV